MVKRRRWRRAENPLPRRAAAVIAVVVYEGSLKKAKAPNEKFEPRFAGNVGRREQKAKAPNEKFEQRFARNVGRREL